MKRRTILITSATAIASIMSLTIPSSGGEITPGRYGTFFEILPVDMCDFAKEEYWLKPPERNGPYWETFCRDVDHYQNTNEKRIKRNYWKTYPNGDSKQIKYTFGYSCTEPGDIITLEGEGVYVDGCEGTWPS